MLKRNIAILIAVGLLSAQAGLVVAQGAFPMGADGGDSWKPLPAVVKYLGATSNSNPTGAKGPVFSSVSGDQYVGSPALNQYFAERAAKIGAERTARGGASVLDELENVPHMQSKPD